MRRLSGHQEEAQPWMPLGWRWKTGSKKVQKICKRCHKLDSISYNVAEIPDWPAPEAARVEEAEGRISGPKSVAHWEVLEALVA